MNNVDLSYIRGCGGIGRHTSGCTAKILETIVGSTPTVPNLKKENQTMNIKGMNKAKILAGLYNSSRPLGMGCFLLF